MKLKHIAVAIALAVLAVVPAFADPTLSGAAQSIVANTEPIRVTGVVTGVDYAQNRMAVVGPEGNELVAPIAVAGRPGRLPIVGDEVLVEFRDVMLATADDPQSSGNGIRTRVDTQIAVPTADGYRTASQVELVATVQHIDRATRAVTLRGPRETVTIKADPAIDLAQFKAGDEIHAVLVDSFALSLASE